MPMLSSVTKAIALLLVQGVIVVTESVQGDTNMCTSPSEEGEYDCYTCKGEPQTCQQGYVPVNLGKVNFGPTQCNPLSHYTCVGVPGDDSKCTSPDGQNGYDCYTCPNEYSLCQSGYTPVQLGTVDSVDCDPLSKYTCMLIKGATETQHNDAWPISDLTFTPWATDTHNGNEDPLWLCSKYSFVSGLQGHEQNGFGITDIRVRCSDGLSGWMGNNEKHGHDNGEIECQDGFGVIRAMQQTFYGIINFETICVEPPIREESNQNYDGSFQQTLECPPGTLMVGMQTRTQSWYGLVNWRLVCAEQNVADMATAEWSFVKYFDSTMTEYAYTVGITNTESTTRTSTWKDSVTAEIGGNLSIWVPALGASATWKVTGTTSQEMSETYSRTWTEETSWSTTVQYGSEYNGKGLWQWSFRIRDVYQHDFVVPTQSVAVTDGQDKPPKCYPNQQNAGEEHEPHQICTSCEGTIPAFRTPDGCQCDSQDENFCHSWPGKPEPLPVFP